MTDIDVARAGAVTWRNHQRLGWERVLRGVYARPVPATGSEWERQRALLVRRARALLASTGHEAVLYGPTALHVLGVALPETQDTTQCHILVHAGQTRSSRPGVVAHATRRTWQVWRTTHGLPVLHPVDHWLQLRGTDDELIEVADGFVRRQHPLLTMAEFRQRLDELAGTSGVQRARRLLRWVRPGTDSIYETRTRLILVRGGLPCPSVNPPVPCRSGFTYNVDMAYERERVAVEYDGGYHGDREQMERDALRRRDLQDEGWLIISVTARQLRDRVSLVRSVEAALVLRHGATWS